MESQAKASIAMDSTDPSNSTLMKTITFEEVGAMAHKVG